MCLAKSKIGFGLATVLLAAFLLPGAQAAPQGQVLTLGFFPLVSTVALFKRYSPLANYLSEQLGRPVRLLTAKDFPTFVQRTADRHYDVVVTAPHFAIRAVDSGSYQIRATSLKDVQQLIVVREDSPIHSLVQLAGSRIATPPGPALMSMMGKDFLARAGLIGPLQPAYHAFTSHNAANQALVAGEADAAIASSNIIGKALQRGEPLRILSEGWEFPNMATMVATDLPAELADEVEQILLDMVESEQGRRVLDQIGFPAYRSVRIADYEVVRPYAYRKHERAAVQ